jgi:hypothetical protein
VVNGLMAAISETVMFVLCVETKKSNKCVGAKRSKMLRGKSFMKSKELLYVSVI